MGVMKRLAGLVLAAVLLGTVYALPAYAAPAAIFTASSTREAPRHVDPIVSPGARSAHEHQFFGAVGVTPDTDTSEEFRALPDTWVTPGNHSGFWIPTLYEDGRLVPSATSKHCLLYYQPVAGTEQVPPEDTAGVTHEVGYRDGTGGGAVTNLPPAVSTTGILVVSGFFRAGRDFGLSQPFPTIRFFCRFAIGTGPIGSVTLGGPMLGVDGALGPDDIHADYAWAWERDVFERFLIQCVRPGTACGTNPTL